jgi:hypothetical protein
LRVPISEQTGDVFLLFGVYLFMFEEFLYLFVVKLGYFLVILLLLGIRAVVFGIGVVGT